MSAELSHDRANWLRVAKERDEIKAEVSKLTDALDMMRDEFQRIIACPGCNGEIEDLANRAQLKLIQRVPVIAQRDQAEAEVSRLRSALFTLIHDCEQNHSESATANHVIKIAKKALGDAP